MLRHILLIVTYFKAMIHLAARCPLFFKALSNRGESVLVGINFICNDTSMASCDKGSRQKITLQSEL